MYNMNAHQPFSYALTGYNFDFGVKVFSWYLNI